MTKKTEQKIRRMLEHMIDIRETALPIEEVLDKPKYHQLCEEILRLEESYKRRTTKWYLPFSKDRRRKDYEKREIWGDSGYA